jgi:hypothetical protein
LLKLICGDSFLEINDDDLRGTPAGPEMHRNLK